MTFESTLVAGEPLAPRTTMGVGGRARFFGVARTETDVADAVGLADARGLPLVPLGAGSNVVVADAGLDALVLGIGLRGISVELRGVRARLTCAAGEPWGEVVDRAVAQGWAGVECLAGIPGLVGATPIQNVGAYGQQVSDTLVSVRALSRSTRRIVDLPASACAFAYRDSVFRSAERDQWIVLAVTFELVVGGEPRVAYAELERHLAARSSRPTVREVSDAVVTLRRRKGMVLDRADSDTRSAGSFFVNPIVAAAEADAIEARAHASGALPAAERMPRFAPETRDDDRVKVPAAWLIERAGIARGTSHGGAATSSKHALAIVNRGDATCADVLG
ncbi:MAG: UDP-N-acetylmuramate dehydrogenase, partial [Deltaproteobacteria bacterium]|nr:UDP-N-acetylmuramate dehydrogenase [Deltaproteobacteria bacterium]